MSTYYYEIWSTGYVEARSKKQAEKILMETVVKDLEKFDNDLAVDVEKEEY